MLKKQMIQNNQTAKKSSKNQRLKQGATGFSDAGAQ